MTLIDEFNLKINLDKRHLLGVNDQIGSMIFWKQYRGLVIKIHHNGVIKNIQNCETSFMDDP